MRATSAATQTAWQSGIFVGATKPMVRATIQRLHVQLTSAGNQVYSSIPFGQASIPVELPNMRSVKWNRGVDGAVASGTITLFNCEVLPLGSTPTRAELDQPGYFTPTHGKTTYSSRWGHATNPWQDWIVPDRIIRTYEGYGFNPAVIPELDAHLYQSGTWMIDDVTFDALGTITIEVRDIGRALIDQILLPPIVPTASYPLWFEKKRPVNNPDIVTTSGGWSRPTYDASSNIPYVGQGAIYGHLAGDAFDTNTASYWLSVGNGAPEDKYSFEWVQGKFSSRTVSAVRVRTWAGPYQVYVSVWSGGKWQGIKTVPYDPNNPVSFPNGSNIRFSWSFTANRETTTTFKFPTAITGATKIRLTFTRLSRSAIGPYYYRAGARTVEISSAVTTTVDGGTHLEPATTPPGANDYTDVVKVLLAYAGWHWPAGTVRPFITRSNGDRVVLSPSPADPVLRNGRVWGDFENAGTMAVVPLGVDFFDKKPVLDCVAQGTLVAVPGGLVPIEDLRLGDLVGNKDGFGRITARASRQATRVVALWVGGERIITSPGHLFLTTKGWKRADEVGPSEDIVSRSEELRLVRDGVRGDHDPLGATQDVLRAMQAAFGGQIEDEPAELCVSSVRGGVQGGLGQEVLLPVVHGGRQDLGSAGVQDLWRGVQAQAVESGVLWDEVQASQAFPDRARGSVGSPVHSLARAWARVASRTLGVPVGGGAGSEVLQAGPGLGAAQDRRGSGWRRTWRTGSDRGRPSARRLASLARVDRVEVLEQGSPQWREHCGSDDPITLWDLSVSGDPSFLVGRGALVVHNCISAIKDVLGFIFFIDETGGAVFRSQNIWSVGNYIGDTAATAGRTTSVITIDEQTTLMSASAKLSSRSIRERIFVGNLAGQIGAMTLGHNPYPSGLRRVAAWIDQHFLTARECQIMSDLIGLRQLFTYRQNKIKIPGNPAIQIDDQVRIYERVTEEGYLHYVTDIAMSWDIETGRYEYELGTHWLGDTAFSNWTFNPTDLSAVTQAYLRALGKIP